MRAQVLSQQAGLDGRKFPREHREGLTAALARCPPPLRFCFEFREGKRLPSMLLTIKDLSKQLQIKPSTLYSWVAQRKIPCRKIHGLIRFEQEVIKEWVRSFEPSQPKPLPFFGQPPPTGLDLLIEAAKRDAYTARHGETISPSPFRKEEENGAR